ncbi:hypothetical protein HDV57DRAFT_489888 [Trichoderma longibrachiatum]
MQMFNEQPGESRSRHLMPRSAFDMRDTPAAPPRILPLSSLCSGLSIVSCKYRCALLGDMMSYEVLPCRPNCWHELVARWNRTSLYMCLCLVPVPVTSIPGAWGMPKHNLQVRLPCRATTVCTSTRDEERGTDRWSKRASSLLHQYTIRGKRG